MKYTVVMEKMAENQLARIWNRAGDQQEVADASNRIERELGNDAHTKGNPFGIFRTYRDDPLEYLFHVDPGDCMVRVFGIRRAT
ncbi:MAG TPA: hypothetical protein VH592_15380 [Gemmataceae bacterium]|jgi:hypothetical protein